jgi:hypothetical protein
VHVSQGCGHHLHFLVGHPSVHYFQAQKCLPKMVKTALAVVAESITGFLISKTSFLPWILGAYFFLLHLVKNLCEENWNGCSVAGPYANHSLL